MNGAIPPELEKEIAAHCEEMWRKLAEARAAGYADRLALWRAAHAIYLETAAASLAEWVEQPGQADCLEIIEADFFIGEITDKHTGRVFRRTLPVNYCETDNGVILAGETLEGAPARLALLSSAALAKVPALFGRGPDVHRCQDE